MNTDTLEVRKFLSIWEPLGEFWGMTAIRIDQKGTVTRTFSPGEIEEALQWIILQNEVERRNLYFTVNSVKEKTGIKPSRDDIKELRWLHVDIDPRKGEDLAQEQKRIEALISSDNPAGLPSPSLVTFSGGGYQAFWRLKSPAVVIDINHAEELKLYNLQIENQLGGDKCHNIDRLMRIPGTINWPSEKKIKSGRVPSMARLVLARNVAYDLTAFKKAKVERLKPTHQNGVAIGHTLNIPDLKSIPRLKSIEELPSEVKDYTKVVIVQGGDPEDPQKWGGDRSDVVWYVACELVRAGATDLMIYSILTDPAFGISSHILEQKNPEKVALRTIERAREMAIDPKLLELNERHAVIADISGRCMVVSEIFDHNMGRVRISRQTFEHFSNRYLNEKIESEDGKFSAPIGRWWLHHPRRRQYESLVFAPGQDIPGAYNMWRGFAVESKAGDCSVFLDHMKNVLCKGDEEAYQYLLFWMANAVQRPAEPGQVAVVLKGRMGTGKSFFSSTFGSLFGRHYIAVSDSKHLVGSFNAHLRDCVILFADEAFYAGDKKHEAILKTLITESSLAIESKGYDIEIQKNCTHLIMASNESWAVPVDMDDRRFFVLDVSDERMQDRSYFREMAQSMRAGGSSALLNFLQSLPLDDFDVRNRPKTAALRKEKLLSMSMEMDWWYGCLREGRVLLGDGEWPPYVLTDALQASMMRHCKIWKTYSARSSQTRLGQFLRKVLPQPLKKRRLMGISGYKDADGRDVTVENGVALLLPPLEACRKRWESEFELLEPWPEDYENVSLKTLKP